MTRISFSAAKFSLAFLCVCGGLKFGLAGDDDSWSAMSSVATKINDDCKKRDYELIDCLKVKLVSSLDRVFRKDVIRLGDHISLIREDNEASRAHRGRAMSENDVESSLTNEAQKGGKLNEMIFDKISQFFGGYSLKIALPRIDSSVEEGRGKMKKTMSMFMMGAMMKAMMMIPLSIGTLFFLAGKALIISKIALVLSLLLTMKKLLAKPTEHVVHESHGWNPSASTGGWDKRSYKILQDANNAYTNGNQNAAQNLAYNSYANQK